MRLLDLYCGAGGAAAGYAAAGFEVTGVDIASQPRYPFRFVQADALEYLAEHGHEFDAVHASPPCQHYSTSTVALRRAGKAYPDMIDATRAALDATGRPYVIENVPGAPLRFPVELCGSMFELGALCGDGEFRPLRRHRRFELSWTSWELPPAVCRCWSTGEKIGVYGNGGGWANRLSPDRCGYKGNAAESSQALGIDWMSIAELSQAIPPRYTQWIGERLAGHLRTGVAA